MFTLYTNLIVTVESGIISKLICLISKLSLLAFYLISITFNDLFVFSMFPKAAQPVFEIPFHERSKISNDWFF